MISDDRLATGVLLCPRVGQERAACKSVRGTREKEAKRAQLGFPCCYLLESRFYLYAFRLGEVFWNSKSNIEPRLVTWIG